MSPLQVRQYIRSAVRWLDVKQLSIEDRNILLFTIDTGLQGLMMGGIFSFISVFVVRLGASKLMVSLVTSLPAIVLMLFSIPAGQYVQRRTNLVRLTNQVRLVHRGSFLLIALLPFVTKRYLVELVILVWAAKSVASAVLESSWMGVVAEVIPEARRASVNGARWAVMSLVTGISVAVFGYILHRSPFPLGYQIVFAVSCLGGLAGMGFFARMYLPDVPPIVRAENRRTSLRRMLPDYLRTISLPAFVRYEATTFVLRLAVNLPIALYSVYWIRHLDATDLWIGWQATANKMALIAGYFIWGRVVSQRGHHIALLVCTIGTGAYPVLMGLVPSQEWLPAVAIVQGFFVTGIDLAFFDTLLAVCPAQKRATFISCNTLLSSLAIFLAPMLGSLLAEWMDIRLVFWVSTALHLLSALLFWRLRVTVD